MNFLLIAAGALSQSLHAVRRGSRAKRGIAAGFVLFSRSSEMDFRLQLSPVVKAEAGFSLLETLVAISILSIGVGGLAQFSVIAADANRRARVITTASVLAQQKMEQLRALAWRFDPIGLRVSDETSDTSVTPEAPSGGAGLSVSPAASLATNTGGYCDFVDASGRLLGDGGGGSAVPPSALYVRRWSIAPVPADPDNTIVIQVIVTMTGSQHSGESARFVSVRTRRGV